MVRASLLFAFWSSGIFTRMSYRPMLCRSTFCCRVYVHSATLKAGISTDAVSVVSCPLTISVSSSDVISVAP